jgi:hypothetical protein
MMRCARTFLIPHFKHLAGFQFRGIATAVVAIGLLMMVATPSMALTFSWSFVTTGDSDNVGETISGLIAGLHEGDNLGSELDDLYVSVTGTPTDGLLLDDWGFYSLTDPTTTVAFTVTGGVMTFANAAFFIGGDLLGPELYFSLNNTVGWYSPMLADRNIPVYWYAGWGDNTAFTPRAYYTLNPDLNLSWAQLSLTDDGKRFIEAAKFNNATTSFAPAPEVPIPAALPLYAAGLGAMGFFGWRKRKAAPAA